MVNKLMHFILGNKNLLLRIFLFILTGIIIVYQIPKEYRFSYEYTKGAPWLHENLIAPYDFPIYKLESDFFLEKDSIERSFIPFFSLDKSVQNIQIQGYRNKLFQEWALANTTEAGTSYKSADSLTMLSRKINQGIILLTQKLDNLYTQGILEGSKETDQLLQGKIYLRMRQDEISSNVLIGRLNTEKSAYLQMNSFIDSIADIFVVDSNRKKFMQLMSNASVSDFIRPNIYFDNATTQKMLKAALQSISPSLGIVQKGEAIILKGEIVTESKYRRLESYRKEFENLSGIGLNVMLIVLAQIVLIGLMLLILFLFLYQFRKALYDKLNVILFLLLLLLIEITITRVFVSTELLHVYLIPYIIFPLLIKSYFDARTAVFFHMISILLTAFLVANSNEFIVLQMLTGFLAIFSLENMKKRSQLFELSFLVFSAYSIIYLAFSITYGETFRSFKWDIVSYFAINSLLLLLAYPLIYLFEKMFGFISDLTLIELADTNNPLLRNLAEKAAGTFQHSLQVSNLAEQAIVKLRGNSLLVRVGALYHDIGKLSAPEYFTENQANNFNPHNQLSEIESAKVIIKHVTEGEKMARKAKLPQAIIDFIVTHHGTTRTEYFYRTFKTKHPEKLVDESVFTYPGPKPFSKETAVLMMADSVEAASRSLKSYTHQDIDQLVDKIIDYQIERGQFDNSPISFRHVSIIKATFKQKLKNIYHSRIAYPEEVKEHNVVV